LIEPQARSPLYTNFTDELGDLRELDAAGLISRDEFRQFRLRAREECDGFGLFIRSLVGLDRKAAKELFAEFLSEGTHTATHIQFINEIINELTSRGVMDPARLHDPPFSDLATTEGSPIRGTQSGGTGRRPPDLQALPQDALLTVVWIAPAEQRHFLIKGCGSRVHFRRWLRHLHPALDLSIGAVTPADLQAIISALNGTPIPSPSHPLSGYRYLLTIAVKRRRVLLSAWSREGPTGWRRLWFPKQVGAMTSPSPPAG
jgi:hypothetical protein